MLRQRGMGRLLTLLALLLLQHQPQVAVAQSGGPPPQNPPVSTRPARDRSTPRARATPTAAVAPDALPIQVLTHGVPEPQTVDDLITIRGLVYDDANGNGARDPDELALKGVSIASEALADEQGHTRIASSAVSDAQGRFALVASTRTLLTVQAPDGWRVIGPVTRFATQEMAFGLRQERIGVERVITLAPDLKVALDVAVPPPAPARITLDQTTQANWAALILGLAGLAATLLIALALWAHSRAHARAALHVALTRAARARLTDADWAQAVEQVLANGGVSGAQVERFLGMGTSTGATGGWMRFSDRDGRVYTLAAGRAGLRAANIAGANRRLNRAHPLTLARLHAVWRHFAPGVAQSRVLPEGAQWWLAQSPQPVGRLVSLWRALTTRAQVAGDRLRGRLDQRAGYRQRVRMQVGTQPLALPARDGTS